MNDEKYARRPSVLTAQFGSKAQWRDWWENGPVGDKVFGAFVLGALSVLLGFAAVKFL